MALPALSARNRIFIPPVVADRLRKEIARRDLVVDLGTAIGSPDWFRGLATLTLLVGSAAYVGFVAQPLPAPVTARYSTTQAREASAQAIQPLALGAATGRRMAPTAAVEMLAEAPERPRIELTSTLGSGTNFGRALVRAGVGEDEARRVAQMVGGAVPLGDLKSGTSLDIALGRRETKAVARPLESLAFRAAFDLKLAVERVDGDLRLKRIPIAVDNTPLRITGAVGSSVYQTARSLGAPASAVGDYLKAMGGAVSISSLGRSDRFDLIIEHRRAETGETETGKLLYAGLERGGGKKIRLLRFTDGGRTQFFNADGVGAREGGLVRPVANWRVSSGFGLRIHPLLGFSRMHKGIDLAAPMGAPIVAPASGTVTFAGRHGGHGNYMMVKHSGEFSTAFAHLSRFAAQPGQQVKAGQVIAYVGSTGLSTGPHLHYEMWKNGQAVNPLSVKFSTQAQLSGEALRHFKAQLGRLLSVRVGGDGVTTAAKEEGGKKAG